MKKPMCIIFKSVLAIHFGRPVFCKITQRVGHLDVQIYAPSLHDLLRFLLALQTQPSWSVKG